MHEGGGENQIPGPLKTIPLAKTRTLASPRLLCSRRTRASGRVSLPLLLVGVVLEEASRQPVDVVDARLEADQPLQATREVLFELALQLIERNRRDLAEQLVVHRAPLELRHLVLQLLEVLVVL